MRAVRFIAPILFAVQLALHKGFEGIWSDLFLFNSIAIATLISVLAAPRINNKWAQLMTALAIGSWQASRDLDK